MTILSLSQATVFADLGLGFAMVTAVGHAMGSMDQRRLVSCISSGFLALLIASGSLLLLLLLATASYYYLLPVFGDGGTTGGQNLTAALLILFGLALLSGPAKLGFNVQTGIQAGHIANLWQAAGNVLVLLTVLALVRQSSGLLAIVTAFFAVPCIVAAVNAIWYFRWSRPELRPRLSRAAVPEIRAMGRSSILFFAMQLFWAFTFAADNAILLYALDANAVTAYAVQARIFSYITVGLLIFLTPLWPAYAEAHGRGDAAWIIRTYARSLALSVACAAVCSAAVYSFRTEIFALWIGSAFTVDASLVAALAVWTVIEAAGSATTVLLNGLNAVRVQVLVFALLAAVSIPCRLILISKFGATGLPVGTSIAYAACVALPLLFFVPRTLARLRGR
jgi:O-antigen/teichoic acid export membrane protein